MKSIKIVSILAIAFLGLFVTSGSIFAATSTTSTDEYAEAKVLIQQNVPCQNLSQDQLTTIGDYYMEQMMPGQAHKNMEQTLGGEGSESLRQAHIFMARRWYCGDAAGYGMMGMMGGAQYNQAYGSRMMGYGLNDGTVNPRYGMMGGWNTPNWNTGYDMMGLGTGNGWGGGIMMILTTVLLLAGVALIIKYLIKK